MLKKAYKWALEEGFKTIIKAGVGAVLGAGISQSLPQLPVELVIALIALSILFILLTLLLAIPSLRNYFESLMSPWIYERFKSRVREAEMILRASAKDQPGNEHLEKLNEKFLADRDRLKRVIILNKELITAYYRSKSATKRHELAWNNLMNILTPSEAWNWMRESGRDTKDGLDCFDYVFTLIQNEASLFKQEKGVTRKRV